jgi:hypothetical protein
MTTPRVFGMGACLLSGPLSEAIRSGWIARNTVGRGGPTPGTYSFGEMFQLLDFLENRITIAPEHRAICGYREAYEPASGAEGFVGADVCLIEPNGVVDIEWNGLKINRAQLLACVANPIKLIDRDAAKAANNWYNMGLLAVNDEVRKELADKLVSKLPQGMENREFILDVLKNTRSIQRNAQADMTTLTQRVPIPIGVVAYAYQYLPDGRPMFWPSDLQKQIKSAAVREGLPYFEPWKLVLEQGGAPALKPDLRHYQEEFIPTVSRSFAKFSSQVAAKNLATS